MTVPLTSAGAEPREVFRQAPAVLAVGALSLILGVWLTAQHVATQGVRGLSVLEFTAWFVLGGLGVLRQRIEVMPTEVVFCNGIRSRRVDRAAVDAVCFDRYRDRLGRLARLLTPVMHPNVGGLYLRTAEGAMFRVPMAQATDVERVRMLPRDICDWLTDQLRAS